MENTTFFQAYLITFLVCTAVTLGLIALINKGLKIYFENLCQDKEIAAFFRKLTNIIILLGGLAGALIGGYTTGKDANFLTLTFEVSKQISDSLDRLFMALMIFAIAFFILHIIAKRVNK